jgi:hypothetical protein
MLERAGASVWTNPEQIQQIADASIAMALAITGTTIEIPEGTMALPDVFKRQSGTAKTIKNSGGDAAITLASLANSSSESTGARQSVKLDLGATRGRSYQVKADFELAATPTAGNVIELWWSPSSSATAGTDNKGNASGTDASYTGYSSNISASLKQCQLIGAFVCTSQATSTVQKATVAGAFVPQERYGSLIVFNKAGSAFHSSDTNQVITLTPSEDVIED